MSNTYRLKDDGYPWRVIYNGRNKVGRVYKHADGQWRGTIAAHEASGPDAVTAFRRVAARALGFATVDALRSQNRAVRRQKNMRRATLQALAHQFLYGSNVEQQCNIIEGVAQNAVTAAEFVNVMTREITRK